MCHKYWHRQTRKKAKNTGKERGVYVVRIIDTSRIVYIDSKLAMGGLTALQA
jgi:hypothetical protein